MSRALHQLSAAGQGPLRGHQLRGDPREPPGERAVRPREGGLHRRRRAQGRQGRARPQGDALPRRDRRPAAPAPGQDPAPGPGAAVRAGRRAPDADRGRAGGGRHQPGPPEARRGEAVSRGPLLPPLGLPDRDPAAATTPRRHPACSPTPSWSASAGRWDAGASSSSDEAKRALSAHSWPGNVRELQNCLERALILCDGSRIEPAHLRLEPPVRSGPTLADVVDLSGPLPEVARRVAALRRGRGDRPRHAGDRGRPRGRRRAAGRQPLRR